MMNDLEFQQQLMDDAVLIKWRNKVDLPKVRTRIHEHITEMGREGQLIRLESLYERLMDDESELFWQCKRYEQAKAKDRPYSELAQIAYSMPEKSTRVKKIEREIEYLQAVLFKPETVRKDVITPDMIERAKYYPIEDLIEARLGMALCIFHEDHSPSMYVKNNFAHCFSCGKTADTIDVYKKLHGVDFITAVRALQ